MKAQLLMLSAAGLLFAGSASHAALPESQQYAGRANARAEALLRAAGIDDQVQPVSVRASVSPDGHLTGLRIIRTSGSRDTDRAVAEVLRKVLVADAPVGLLNGAVTLNVGQGALIQADGR
ncbi:MAG TPA: TonB C-terminal domain-containing protein [Phenylobacterium sp.]|nr:TonB C-terminal domain-containing protein [Phenylobacterium sp.]